MRKSSLAALFLAFIPGAGHLYLNKKRGFLYLAGFIFPIIVGLMISFIDGWQHEGYFVFGLLSAFIVGVVNMLDMVITLIRRSAVSQTSTTPLDNHTLNNVSTEQRE